MIGPGVATTPTPTTPSRPSILGGPTASAARGATASTSRSRSTTSPRPASGRIAWSASSTTPISTFDDDGRFSFMVGPSRPAGLRRAVHRADATTRPPRSRATTSFTRIAAHESSGRSNPSIRRTPTHTPTRTTPRRSAPRCGGCRRCSPSCRSRSSPARTRRRSGTTRRSGANTCAAPYQVPDANYGWSARDACYSFGSFSLRPDEALVDHPPAAGVPVLEPDGVEPVHGRLQRRLRPHVDQPRQRRTERRRHGHRRDRARSAGPPELDLDDRPRRRRDRLSLVPSPTRCPTRPSSSWSRSADAPRTTR